MFNMLVSVFFYIGIAALGFLILAVLLLTVFKTQDIIREEEYEKMLLEEEEAKKAKVVEQKELSLKESLDLLKNEDTESEFNKEYVIKFADLDISKNYYCLFRVKDRQGNVYVSKMVEINNK